MTVISLSRHRKNVGDAARFSAYQNEYRSTASIKLFLLLLEAFWSVTTPATTSRPPDPDLTTTMESEAKAASGAVPPVDAPAAVTAQSPAVASGSKGAPKEKKEKAEKAGPPQPKGDKKEKPAKPGAGASAAGAKAGGKDSKKAGAAGAGKPKAEVKVVGFLAIFLASSRRPSCPSKSPLGHSFRLQADGFRHIPVSVHDKDAPVADLTPPADLHDSFVALAASLTSTVGVEGSVYAAALLKASIQAIGDYNRPENKVCFASLPSVHPLAQLFMVPA